MNIKSLLLGSAAALVAVSGAKAADAVVAAEPEPVEYVRVCDVYGTGYFYIPGTETCLKIGGYVEYRFYGGDLYARTARDHFDGTPNDAWTQRTRFELDVDTATETELGTLKTSAGVDFDWVDNPDDDDLPAGTPVDGNAEDGFHLDHAWFDLAGLRIGKYDSFFTSFLGYVPIGVHDALIPYGPYDTNSITYTFTGGNGFSAFVGADEGSGPGASLDGHDYTIDSYVPHLLAGAKIVQGWGGVGIVGGYDSIHEAFTIKGRIDAKFNDAFSVYVMGGWGEDGNTGFNFYKPWGGHWGVWGGGTAKLSEKADLNLELAYDDDDNFAAVVDLAYDIVPGLEIRPEVSYVDPGAAGVDDAWGAGIRFRRSF